MKQDMDPRVLHADTYREFRVQLWEYMTLDMLRAFAHVAEAGDFGDIRSFHGVGRTPDKKAYAFQWKKGEDLHIEKTGRLKSGGQVILKGDLDFATINRVRNFRLFHMRGALA